MKIIEKNSIRHRLIRIVLLAAGAALCISIFSVEVKSIGVEKGIEGGVSFHSC